MKLSETRKAELIDEMVDFLIKESGIKPNFDYTKLDKRKLLNNLLILHSTENLGDYFYSLQDQLLKDENKKYTRVEALQFKQNVAYADADITSINADIAVHFSDNLIPMQIKEDKDSAILLKTGVQLGCEYYKAFKENGFILDYNTPYLTDGYNLPASNIAKVLVGQGEVVENVKKIFDFAIEQDLITVFLDLEGTGVGEKEIISITPKNIKLIFKKG